MSRIPHDQNSTHEPPATEVHFHLLGLTEFDRCLELQRRLAYEANYSGARKIVVLLCEHKPIITVGRIGSWAHIRLTAQQLRKRNLEVRWVGRSGGCLLHAPGQLAVYPIAPISICGWSRNDYTLRLSSALHGAMQNLRIRHRTDPATGAVWGRSGQLAALGIECRRGVAWHGAFVNVNPEMADYRRVDVAPVAENGVSTMGSLLAEPAAAVKMTQVRAALIESLAAALGCEQYFLHTGHPHWNERSGDSREFLPRAG